jgi:SAM-dependent methyltransferase
MLANALSGVKPSSISPVAYAQRHGAIRLPDWLDQPSGRALWQSLADHGAAIAQRVRTRTELTIDLPSSPLNDFSERLGVHRVTLRSTDGATVEAPFEAYLDALPIGNVEVGLIILGPLLHALADPWSLIRECARILEPGGVLIVLGLNPLSIDAWRERLRPNGALPLELIERGATALTPKRLARRMVASDLDTMYVDWINHPDAAPWRQKMQPIVTALAVGFALLAVKRRPLLLTRRTPLKLRRALRPLAADPTLRR